MIRVPKLLGDYSFASFSTRMLAGRRPSIRLPLLAIVTIFSNPCLAQGLEQIPFYVFEDDYEEGGQVKSVPDGMLLRRRTTTDLTNADLQEMTFEVRDWSGPVIPIARPTDPALAERE